MCQRPASPKPPTLFDEVGARGSLKHLSQETRSSASAGLEAASHSVMYRWGSGTMRNRIVFKEGSVEAMASLREQDDEFCRRLRAAVEWGSEFCPTTVITEPCTSRPIFNYTGRTSSAAKGASPKRCSRHLSPGAVFSCLVPMPVSIVTSKYQVSRHGPHRLSQ